MKCSSKCIEAIKAFEGFRAKPYVCPGGVLTIGYGHTGRDVTPRSVVDEAQAEELLRKDLRTFEIWVENYMPQATQGQFDALVSLIYNIGIGAFSASTLKKKIDRKNGSQKEIEKQWRRWVYAKNKILPGLVTRREWEITQFFCQG